MPFYRCSDQLFYYRYYYYYYCRYYLNRPFYSAVLTYRSASAIPTVCYRLSTAENSSSAKYLVTEYLPIILFYSTYYILPRYLSTFITITTITTITVTTVIITTTAIISSLLLS